ncbi:hypothetical protein BD413DRAFT_495027 [Trametes elegans]|nr:hypothetical protein BD413DRAFT_495027 [Trametes elegans]
MYETGLGEMSPAMGIGNADGTRTATTAADGEEESESDGERGAAVDERGGQGDSSDFTVDAALNASEVVLCHYRGITIFYEPRHQYRTNHDVPAELGLAPSKAACWPTICNSMFLTGRANEDKRVPCCHAITAIVRAPLKIKGSQDMSSSSNHSARQQGPHLLMLSAQLTSRSSLPPGTPGAILRCPQAVGIRTTLPTHAAQLQLARAQRSPTHPVNIAPQHLVYVNRQCANAPSCSTSVDHWQPKLPSGASLMVAHLAIVPGRDDPGRPSC